MAFSVLAVPREASVMLLDRLPERAALSALLDAARAGRSGVLVVRGEPGVGKTALLEYAVESAAGLRVVRVAGVESEMELAFAALQQLCAPRVLFAQAGDQSDGLSAAHTMSRSELRRRRDALIADEYVRLGVPTPILLALPLAHAAPPIGVLEWRLLFRRRHCLDDDGVQAVPLR
jgi:hypothetical protein